MNDHEISALQKASLGYASLDEWKGDIEVLDYGALILCTEGAADMQVNYKQWSLKPGAVIIVFPNDIVRIDNSTADFRVQMLCYNPSLLREASLQLEQTVYSLLREDRCRGEDHEVTDIVTALFGLLDVYFRQKDCTCLTPLVLLQLKAFFLGFHDYVLRHPSIAPALQGTRRVNELFSQFMMLVEHHYKDSRNVSYYADAMNITSKYLNNIVQTKTQHTPKSIIDHYVALQLKLQLRTTSLSIKQMAWDYHFSDVSFFCRYFKLHTGLSPQQYRTNHANAEKRT